MCQFCLWSFESDYPVLSRADLELRGSSDLSAPGPGTSGTSPQHSHPFFFFYRQFFWFDLYYYCLSICLSLTWSLCLPNACLRFTYLPFFFQLCRWELRLQVWGPFFLSVFASVCLLWGRPALTQGWWAPVTAASAIGFWRAGGGGCHGCCAYILWFSGGLGGLSNDVWLPQFFFV